MGTCTEIIITNDHIFTVGDLKYLKKGGRISAAEAAIGNLLSIKPILKADDNGKIVLHDKIRLRKKALEYLINMTKERIEQVKQTMPERFGELSVGTGCCRHSDRGSLFVL